MFTDFEQITWELKARRSALLNAYDDEDLHQLRVNIRRVRTLLMHKPGADTTALRQSWGKLARNTNTARDWDTFAAYVASELPGKQWLKLQPLVTEYRARARGHVLGMLESDDWDTALRLWNKLVRGSGGDLIASGECKTLGEDIRVLEGAQKAAQRALAWGDEASWHKFRIAVKNLRYTLDNRDVGSNHRRTDTTSTIKLCKRLQKDLGDWHDAVVHRNLLAQLAEVPDVIENPKLSPVLNVLGAAIQTRGADALAKVNVILHRRDSQFITAEEKASPGF